jgi:hypothetical protein
MKYRSEYTTYYLIFKRSTNRQTFKTTYTSKKTTTTPSSGRATSWSFKVHEFTCRYCFTQIFFVLWVLPDLLTFYLDPQISMYNVSSTDPWMMNITYAVVQPFLHSKPLSFQVKYKLFSLYRKQWLVAVDFQIQLTVNDNLIEWEDDQ